MNDRLPPQDARRDTTASADSTLQSYRAVRMASERLAAPLSAEDCAIQSMADASPVKWHLAHTSWFFETFVLAPHLPGYRLFHPSFRMLFNSYYNSVGDKHPRPSRGLLSRPSLQEVHAYRAHVDAAMAELLDRDSDAAAAGLIELGINHEQQHQELILTDVLHLFSCNPLKPAYAPQRALADPPRGDAPDLEWIGFDEGVVEIGYQGSGFAFDNETPRHRQYLNAFQLASRLVTNDEYRAFIEDGAYRRPELWLSEGWDWVKAHAIDAPFYWHRESSGWLEFGLRGLHPLQSSAPVCHVSLYESDAYARWAGVRLPSEAEWEVAAGDRSVDGNFVESELLAPRAASPGAAAPLQLFGDVWEWTASAYAAYPGYRPANGAIGEYNGKFMCNQYVLRGGSCVSPRSHLRATYRNFFPAPARWQFTGIRLARDSS